MGYVFGIIALTFIALLTGLVIGVVICTETETDILADDVSRETSKKGKTDDE